MSDNNDELIKQAIAEQERLAREKLEREREEIRKRTERLEELKWMTRKYSWRYIPARYQVTVATITAGLLYFNMVNILLQPTASDSGACGSLLRPVFRDENTPGWFWRTSAFVVNNDLVCPRHVYGLWWQLIGTFVALAICGAVMRRAIRKDG